MFLMYWLFKNTNTFVFVLTVLSLKKKQCVQYTLLTFVSFIQLLILLTVSDFKNLTGY